MSDTRPALAFDVNETLLDLSSLDALFGELFGEPSFRKTWFSMMLQVAFVGTITDRYVNFSEAQAAALQMLASQLGRSGVYERWEEVQGAMRRLPAHGDVEPALRQLRGSGFRMAALTNSTSEVAHDQLSNAGILDIFDLVVSADEVRALKPAPEPYRLAAKRLDVAGGEMMLIAAHAWDVSGALAAGFRAAFIRRSGAVPAPIGPQPEIVADGLDGLASRLVAAAAQ